MPRIIYFEYWQGKKDGQWYCQIRSRNWKKRWIGGEGFSSRRSVEGAINRLLDDICPRVDYIVREVRDPN